MHEVVLTRTHAGTYRVTWRGHRIGVVTGGHGRWIYETRGGRTMGLFRTRTAAVYALIQMTKEVLP